MALKRLVTSAATIAVLGCSGGASDNDGALAPPFSGVIPNAGTPPVDTAGVTEQTPSEAAPGSPANGAGDAPTAGQVPSEGQNPDNIGIDNTEGSGSVPGGGDAPTDTQAGAAQPGGEQPTSTDEPPPAEETPVEPEPVPEEPPAIVRPALDCGAPPPQLQGGIQSCQSDSLGSVGGQDWFLWFDSGAGCQTTFDTPSGAFSANWNNPGDFLARLGFWFDETQTFEEIGELGADLKFTRQGSAGNFSFIGIYGWTTDPLIEYYIVEDSFGNGPAQPFNTQNRGNFNVDGAQYNIHVGDRRNLPSILGMNADFTQVLSVRQNPRQCGHVSISEHFRQWERMGINLGQAKEAKILVEAGGGNGNGSITFSHANITVTPPE